ncbi:hypothetical protein LUZ60_005566 [Juncus effusus]|nr:hypothetical protein LUZ60_005566 [Juncus effusus]
MASLFSPHLSNPKPLSSFPLLRSTSLTTSSPSSPPSTASHLEETFGRKGIKFTDSSVELCIRNHSSLTVRLSDALVTSYKPKVFWKEGDEGCREILHTVQAADESLKGGIGLIFNDLSQSTKTGSPWSPSNWVVKDADSDSFDAVQVELGCTNANGTLDITYVISLYEVSMATAVIVKNKGPKPIELTSAMLNHIKFDSRRGTAMEGLVGCSYCSHPPPASDFGIMSAAEAMKADEPGWFGSAEEEPKKGVWVEEDCKYTMLKKKVSRVYAAPPSVRSKKVYRTAPSKWTTIDQASGLGFRVVRMGYEDIYLSSPGSFFKKYGKDYFICTGPASMLVPVILNPDEEWRAAQVIEHDNL